MLDPKDHPRFSQYLAECNAAIAKDETTKLPTFYDWLIGNDKLKSTPPPEPPKSEPRFPTKEEIERDNRRSRERSIAHIGHHRAGEWLDWCSQQMKSAREAGLPEGTLRLPPFHMWLKIDEEEKERERNRPRIRTANPPEGNVYHANKFFNKVFRPSYSEELLKPWVLTTITRTFQAVLANDKTKVTIAITFQIPKLNEALLPELVKITEKELLLDINRYTQPPSPYEIQKQLHWNLVGFQNENNIAVLRIDVVPTVPPDSATPGSIPDGYVAHVVSTKLGIITYAYKPSTLGLADIFFESTTDEALIKIIKNNPNANLQAHQKNLRVVIIDIDRKQSNLGFSSPVGDPL